MKARDVMTPHAACLPENASLGDAARLMWDHSCGFVPVVRAEDGQLCGVLTDRDVCMGSFTQSQAPQALPVGLAMSRSVATCRPDDDLVTVEKVMRDHRVRRVPVVDEARQVVGILSLDDLARVALEPGSQQHELQEAVGHTLGLVSAPSPHQALSRILHHESQA